MSVQDHGRGASGSSAPAGMVARGADDGVRHARLALVAVAIGLATVVVADLGAETTVALLALGTIAASHQALTLLRVPWTRPLGGAPGIVIETGLASAAVVVLALLESPRIAAGSGGFAAYFVVVGLTTLHRRPLLPVIAGGLGALQYGLLHLVVLRPTVGGALDGLIGERILWLLLGSASVGVASHALRQLVDRSLDDHLQRQRAESALGRYVSRGVAEELLRDGASPAPQRKTVTVLFCDLRGFTFLCERERPEDVVDLLNVFYEQACAVIEREGGTVNKFLGDGLLALFGAPADHPGHAAAAADAALDLMGLVRALRERGGVWTHLAVGIGLDTGAVVLGPIGSRDRAEYTAIGSPVNRAARLQSLAKREHRRIIVSTATRRALPDGFRLAALGRVELKGFAAPEKVYALTARTTATARVDTDAQLPQRVA